MKHSFCSGKAPLVTYIEFLILTSLLIAENSGIDLIKVIFDRTAGETLLSPGTLYAALKRMLRSKWITETNNMFVDTDGRPERKRYYRLTPTGREMIIKENNRARALVAETDELIEQEICQAPERGKSFSRTPH